MHSCIHTCHAAAAAAEALLPGRDVEEVQALLELFAPRYLPAHTELPESAWGMAPEDERLPVSSLGEPVLPWLRATAELPEASSPAAAPTSP